MHVNMDDRIFITIEDEINYIKSYLRIQEFRYKSKLTYSISAEAGVEKLMTLKLLLQPIVENSMIHGFSSLKTEAILSIKILIENDILKIRVQDNGCGMSEQLCDSILKGTVKSKGIGLNNIISRINMYFGDPYGVSIYSKKTLFTIVELSLPIITQDGVEEYV